MISGCYDTSWMLFIDYVLVSFHDDDDVICNHLGVKYKTQIATRLGKQCCRGAADHFYWWCLEPHRSWLVKLTKCLSTAATHRALPVINRNERNETKRKRACAKIRPLYCRCLLIERQLHRSIRPNRSRYFDQRKSHLTTRPSATHIARISRK